MRTAFCMEGILHDPAYLMGSSYLPQVTVLSVKFYSVGKFFQKQ